MDSLENKLFKFQRAIRHHEARIIAELKTSLLEMMLLQFVISNGPQKMRTIADHFVIKLSTLTNTVDKAERRQLFRRKHSRADRRVILLGATAKGQKLFSNYKQEVQKVLSQLEGELTKGELNTLIEGLSSLRKAQAE